MIFPQDVLLLTHNQQIHECICEPHEYTKIEVNVWAKTFSANTTCSALYLYRQFIGHTLQTFTQIEKAQIH